MEAENTRNKGEYQIAWITALHIELAAATALLDEIHNEPISFERGRNDNNVYTWGKIWRHNVVLVSLPQGRYGLVSAATTVERLLSSLPHIRIGILVGIGAAIPECGRDIRLGDVAVSHPEGTTSGVVQYDFGKEQVTKFELIGMLAAPHDLLLSALSKLRAEHELEDPRMNEILESAWGRSERFQRNFSHPGPDKDHLFLSGGDGVEVVRPPRANRNPEIHYGTIISGNRLIKNATKRHELATLVGSSAICLEMEAAGLMNNFPCLVIRGISDYADGYKNDDWQRYAAATASAFAKELLRKVPISDMAAQMASQINLANVDEQMTRRKNMREFKQAISQSSYEEGRHRNPLTIEGTCRWFVDHPSFQTWMQSDSAGIVASSTSQSAPLQRPRRSVVLWVNADPGCGKSVLARYLLDRILPSPQRTICYFFFKDDVQDQKTSYNAVSALLHQLVLAHSSLLDGFLTERIDAIGVAGITKSFFTLWQVLKGCINILGQQVICVLDGLDECQAEGRIKLLETIRETAMTSTNLKFLLLSRPNHDIRRAIGTSDSTTLIINADHDEERELISDDIDLVIDVRISQMDLNEGDRSFLLDLFRECKHRTYLWADLTLKIIEQSNGFTRDFARQLIDQVSPGVEDAYRRILNRSVDRLKTLKILCLILSAERPLDIREMRILLALNERQKTHDDLENFLEAEHRFNDTLRNLCGFFVVIVNSKLYLLHQTAREFLLSDKTRSNDVLHTLKQLKTSFSLDMSFDWAHSIPPQIAHVTMVIQARTFLSLTGFESDSWASVELKAYCKYHWLKHLEHAEIDYTDAFLDWIDVASAKASFWHRFVTSAARPFDPKIEVAADYMLQVGAFDGLVCLVKRALLVTYETIPSDIQLSIAINAAVQYDRVEVLEALLSFAACIESTGKDLSTIRQEMKSMPILGHREGSMESSQKSCQRGRLSEFLTGVLSNAFQTIMIRGRIEVERLLVAYGADINMINNQGIAPLHVAKNPSAVRNLLELGADVNVRDRWDRTPLISHFIWGHPRQQCKDMLSLLWTGHTDDLWRYYEDPTDDRFPEYFIRMPLDNIVRSVKPCLECIFFILRHCENHDEFTDEEFAQLSLARATAVRHDPSSAKLIDLRIKAKQYSRLPYPYPSRSISESHAPWQWNKPSTSSGKLRRNKDGNERQSSAASALTRPSELCCAMVRGKPLSHIVKLLHNGLDFNAVDNKGRSFVHCAILHDCGMDVIRLLIDYGTDVKISDLQGQTALHCAASTDSSNEVMQLLIQHGTDINKVDNEGETACYIAVRYGRGWDTINWFINQGADINITPNNSKSMLINALQANYDHEVIELLVKNGVGIQNIYHGGTPMHHAVCSQYTRRTLQLLLDHGQSIHTIGHGQDSVFQVVITKYSDVAEAIVAPVLKLIQENGADINRLDAQGRNTLFHALNWQFPVVIIRLLLDMGANFNTGDYAGVTPLMLASKSPTAERIRLLLDRKADVHAVDFSGRTALHRAIPYCKGSGSQLEGLQLLLEHGADVFAINEVGQSALQMVQSWTSNLPVVQLLLRYADPSRLAQAAKSMTLQGVTATGIVRLFVSAGVRVDARGPSDEYTPLCMACMRQPFRYSLDLVECLLECKADPRIASDNGVSALSYIQSRLGIETRQRLSTLPPSTENEKYQLTVCLMKLQQRCQMLVEEKYEARFNALINPEVNEHEVDEGHRSASPMEFDLISNLSAPTPEGSDEEFAAMDSDEAMSD